MVETREEALASMQTEWIDRGQNRALFPLASPLSERKERYAVVVVGSGYGGSVAASRVARSGRSVCLLERGDEILPGGYPSSEWEALAQFQVDDGRRRIGSPRALFDLRLGAGTSALVGCGLGGTSLINAGVCAEPHAEVFCDAAWPKELQDPEALSRFFQIARRMLGAEPYPQGQPDLAKLRVLEDAARALGKPLIRPPLAVSFADGPSSAGVDQMACTLCGDCCSGCNYGSKNTTLMNYLPDARRHGAEIFMGVRVVRVARGAAGWTVFGEVSGREAGEARSVIEIGAEVVVLAAGTLGSTEILLRSRNEGLELSDQLGRRFSGNGDVLAFAYDGEREVFGVGAGTSAPRTAGLPGPCIAGLIDVRDPDDLGNSRWIEEGTIPGALKPWLLWLLAGAARLSGEGDAPKTLRELKSLLDGPYAGAVSHTLTLLAMGHDSSAGSLGLGPLDRLELRWPGARDEPSTERTLAMLRKVADALGAAFVPTPRLSIPRLFEADPGLITVHPLGGCAMGDSAETGVVNHHGQVFSGRSGTGLHPGLHVADGAILPRSVGANPLLTITALAERNVEILLERHDRSHSGEISDASRVPLPRTRAARPGLRFDERMHGVYVPGTEPADEPPWLGWQRITAAIGRGDVDRSECTLLLTLSTDDIQRFLEADPHVLTVDGSVELRALSSDSLDVVRGRFRIFTPDPQHHDGRRMEYELELRSTSGEEYLLSGDKLLRDDVDFAVWTETTTLRIRVYARRAGSNELLGSGYVRVEAQDFVRQLRTITITSATSRAERLRWIGEFGRFFAGNLFRVYGGVLAEKRILEDAARPRARRALRAPDPEVHRVPTSDGVALRLTRYRGGDKGPVILAPGFGVTAASFAIDTVDTNLVEYLTLRDYDTWLFDYRASPTLASARDDFSIDDIARRDWPAALEHVLRVTRAPNVQAIAHCVGSMSLLMALLAGATGVRSMICSQLTLHALGWWANHLAAGLDVATVLRSAGITTLSTDRHGRLSDHLDQLLRPFPIPDDEARCRSATCRRIFSLFGPSFRHSNLNDATHDAIAEMFGVTSLAAFEQLARIVRHGHAVDRDGANVYMQAANLKRLELPILFVAGRQNNEFSPRSSEKTLELLASVNAPELYRRLCSASTGDPAPLPPSSAPDLYERQVVDGYGHMDFFIGREAHVHIFPMLEDYLART